MVFELRSTPKFEKLFRKLDRDIQVRVLEQVSKLESDPSKGKSLHGTLKGKLSLRIGDYRVIYKVKDNIVYLLAVGHRKKVYRV